jgi:hypothetical protein
MGTAVAYGNLAAKVMCMWLLLNFVLQLVHISLACLFWASHRVTENPLCSYWKRETEYDGSHSKWMGFCPGGEVWTCKCVLRMKFYIFSFKVIGSIDIEICLWMVWLPKTTICDLESSDKLFPYFKMNFFKRCVNYVGSSSWNSWAQQYRCAIKTKLELWGLTLQFAIVPFGRSTVVTWAICGESIRGKSHKQLSILLAT